MYTFNISVWNYFSISISSRFMITFNIYLCFQNPHTEVFLVKCALAWVKEFVDRLYIDLSWFSYVDLTFLSLWYICCSWNIFRKPKKICPKYIPTMVRKTNAGVNKTIKTLWNFTFNTCMKKKPVQVILPVSVF